MDKQLSCLCIIPARGGSKRIPRKNIRLFLGKPIIAYSIVAALKSGLFEEVMVSTDDEEIARISREFGATVPFMRSKQNSDDFSGTGDVVNEVINQYALQGRSFDLACCIYATAPLLRPQRLIEAHKLLVNNDFDATFPVGRFSSPIWRSFKMNAGSKVTLNFPEFEKSRSQDVPDTYFDAGQFYWFYTINMEILPNKNSFGLNKGAIILEEFEVQDIDEHSDWEMAELKYKLLECIP